MHKVAIVGASGYTGVELLRILAGHPEVEITGVTSRQHAGKNVADIFPFLQSCLNFTFEDADPRELAHRSDVVFTAVPHLAAMQLVPALLDAGSRVVDLSADFRLRKCEVYEEWYQSEHTATELLQEAVYGLPELFRDQIASARLIANPGCYPTSAALALAPLLETGQIDHQTIIIDSKSGVSGAGRTVRVDTLYCEVSEGFKAYGLPRHRHTPEIEQTLSSLAESTIKISFTPHLLPVSRGILSTCYAKLIRDIDLSGLLQLYREYYAEDVFVRVLPEGRLPDVNQVRGSNYCNIGLSLDPRTGRVIVLAALDNLVKGAAGQAVQNMNLLLGLNEGMGLLMPPVFP
ncbi:MAG: N-acetyl-gamma-glutamyl-phosphate reductase [Deltaproteobacteria bacterium]|jgi:N-acetyl-gamma-glutamyl-phosphate reductase|nr:N-acetyl-gamma-glutamyl-phosphate reductase [Deltaproteobacteria bacterium]